LQADGADYGFEFAAGVTVQENALVVSLADAQTCAVVVVGRAPGGPPGAASACVWKALQEFVYLHGAPPNIWSDALRAEFTLGLFDFALALSLVRGGGVAGRTVLAGVQSVKKTIERLT
jgi:hypothetical protein